MAGKVGLIVTAAGLGTRFEQPLPKVLVEIDGKPMLQHTLEAFHDVGSFEKKIVTYPKGYHDQFEAITSPYHVTLVEGGETRKSSVFLALEHVKDLEFCLIHDGARPFVSKHMISGILKNRSKEEAIIPVLPISDTIKELVNGYVKKTVNRTNLYTVQTPQLFPVKTLFDAHAIFPDLEVTDEAQLVERIGFSVLTVPGDPKNKKVTYFEDLTA